MKNELVYGLVALLGLAGCGAEMAFKRGAGAESLERDQLACRAQQGQPYERCMESHGWTLHRMDERNPLMVVVPNADNRNYGEGYVPRPASGASLTPPDPKEILNVSSWWKGGAGTEDLKISIAACEKRLGAEHKAAADYKRMTRGMVLCLREAGWYGLQGY